MEPQTLGATLIPIDDARYPDLANTYMAGSQNVERTNIRYLGENRQAIAARISKDGTINNLVRAELTVEERLCMHYFNQFDAYYGLPLQPAFGLVVRSNSREFGGAQAMTTEITNEDLVERHRYTGEDHPPIPIIKLCHRDGDLFPPAHDLDIVLHEYMHVISTFKDPLFDGYSVNIGAFLPTIPRDLRGVEEGFCDYCAISFLREIKRGVLPAFCDMAAPLWAKSFNNEIRLEAARGIELLFPNRAEVIELEDLDNNKFAIRNYHALAWPRPLELLDAEGETEVNGIRTALGADPHVYGKVLCFCFWQVGNLFENAASRREYDKFLKRFHWHIARRVHMRHVLRELLEFIDQQEALLWLVGTFQTTQRFKDELKNTFLPYGFVDEQNGDMVFMDLPGPPPPPAQGRLDLFHMVTNGSLAPII